MRIINQTKNAVLAEDAAIADRMLARIRGLLGREDFKAGKALVIRPCNSIHTLFMRFPIDALFVNKHGKVVKAISSLPPGRLSSVYFSARFVIELPAGTIFSSSTSEGDLISLE